jgi:hypothetical protein
MPAPYCAAAVSMFGMTFVKFIISYPRSTIKLIGKNGKISKKKD